ncbi:unnamed protein product [Echinostoma caproni]|uniref:Uncharacterized protein n=1 Tax=Echinostoma caproni TaxID=27848 RepID=A0A183AV31_9TREM|nr:unnamed protein product [Echinostoma caproni]
MSSQPRPRKQRFPRTDRRRPYGSCARGGPVDDDFASDDDALYFNKRPRHSGSSVARPFRPLKPLFGAKDNCLSNCRIDKRARDEHNEQERSRRRELAVIYELIRCSFSEDDLRYLEPYSGPKSIDKLSYPQVLQVAYHLLREEQHNLMLFERTLDEMKRIEKELVHVGLSVPQRPFYPSISDGYRKVVQVVDNLLKHDKSARTPDGVYEVTPAERAALGNLQLACLRPRPNGTYPEIAECVPSPTISRGSYTDLSFCGRRMRDDQATLLRSRPSDMAHINPAEGTSIWHKVGRKLRRCSSATSVTALESHVPRSHSPQPSDRFRGCDLFMNEDNWDVEDEDIKPLLNSLVPALRDVEEDEDDDIKPLLNSLLPAVMGTEPEDDTDAMIDFLPQLD